MCFNCGKKRIFPSFQIPDGFEKSFWNEHANCKIVTKLEKNSAKSTNYPFNFYPKKIWYFAFNPNHFYPRYIQHLPYDFFEKKFFVQVLYNDHTWNHYFHCVLQYLCLIVSNASLQEGLDFFWIESFLHGPWLNIIGLKRITSMIKWHFIQFFLSKFRKGF